MFDTKFISLNVYALVACLFIALGVYYNNYKWWYLLIIALLYLIILVLGVIKIQWNFFLKSMHTLPVLYYEFKNGHINLANRHKQIVLTFDDGPNGVLTPKVLDILKSAKVPAVFFLIGKEVAANANITERIIAEGHQIGNHSYDHGFNFDWQSSKSMLAEIMQTNELIHTITNTSTSYFRPPYGVTNPNLAKAIQAAGMKSIGWSVRSMDTVAKDGDKLLQTIEKKVKTGSIILLHDTCEITIQILPKLITSLRQKGYEFVLLP